jgi:hypothetical protein
MARLLSESQQSAADQLICTFTSRVLPAGDHRTATRAARAVLAEVVGSNWSRRDGAWRLSNYARLPGGGVELTFSPGRRTSELPIPPGADTWSAGDWGRYGGTAELLRRFDAFCARHGDLSLRAAVARFRDKYTRWAQWRGLSISASTLRAYRRRVDPTSPHFDGNIDRRGRGPRRKGRRRRSSPGRGR